MAKYNKSDSNQNNCNNNSNNNNNNCNNCNPGNNNGGNNNCNTNNNNCNNANNSNVLNNSGNPNNGIGNDLATLFTSQALTRLMYSNNMKIAEFDAILSLLIKARIPFDVQYSPGSRRAAESAEITIYINPVTTLNFTLSFEPGASIFTGAQI